MGRRELGCCDQAGEKLDIDHQIQISNFGLSEYLLKRGVLRQGRKEGAEGSDGFPDKLYGRPGGFIFPAHCSVRGHDTCCPLVSRTGKREENVKLVHMHKQHQMDRWKKSNIADFQRNADMYAEFLS